MTRFIGAADLTGDATDERANHQIILQEIKEFATKQSAQMDALDTKAGLIGATATALIAGFLALINGTGNLDQPQLRPSSTVADRMMLGIEPHTLLLILLGVSFGAYLLVMVGFWLAVKIRSWRVVPDPSTLVIEYWQRSTGETLTDLASTVAETTAENQRTLDDKIKWVGRALLCLMVEVLVLFLATAVGLWADLL